MSEGESTQHLRAEFYDWTFHLGHNPTLSELVRWLNEQGYRVVKPKYVRGVAFGGHVEGELRG